MDKNGDKIMSVKNEMDMFFEKFLKKYEETAVGLPRCPKRKNIDQTIYIGETDSEGYSKWKPIPYGRDESFLRLLEIYGIEKNEDIVEYFSTYYFLRIDIKFKNYLILCSNVFFIYFYNIIFFMFKSKNIFISNCHNSNY